MKNKNPILRNLPDFKWKNDEEAPKSISTRLTRLEGDNLDISGPLCGQKREMNGNAASCESSESDEPSGNDPATTRESAGIKSVAVRTISQCYQKQKWSRDVNWE